MKQFFKMMFASTLGVMLAMGIILTVLISMTIGYIATVGSTPDYTPKSNTVFKIKLDGTLADNPAENPFSALMGDRMTRSRGFISNRGFSPRVALVWKQSADR